jgi:hypothetical protein
VIHADAHVEHDIDTAASCRRMVLRRSRRRLGKSSHRTSAQRAVQLREAASTPNQPQE